MDFDFTLSIFAIVSGTSFLAWLAFKPSKPRHYLSTITPDYRVSYRSPKRTKESK